MEKDLVKVKQFTFKQPYLSRSSQSRITHKLIQEHTFESILQGDIATPNLPVPKGLRSYCLYRIEQILIELERDNPDNRILKAYYGDLYWLFYKNINRLEGKISGIMNVSNNEDFFEFENEGLTNNEQQIVLENTVSASLLDFAYNTLDYGAFKIVASFCKQILLQGLSDDIKISLVRLQIDTGDELIGWDLVECENTDSEIRYEYVSMDVLDNEYKKMKLMFSGFSDASQKTIATALTQEDALRKSLNLISYTGLAMNYFGVFEQELRNIIYKHKKGSSDKHIMWRDLAKIITETSFPILTKFRPKLGQELVKFNRMRNKSAHGEFIHFEEFDQLKKFVFKDRIFEYMSWELNGEIPKIKQMGFIESDVSYNEGKLQIETESFANSVSELEIVNENFDELVKVEEHSIHPEVQHYLDLIRKGELVLTSYFDGGTLLFEKVGYKKYEVIRFNSMNLELDRRRITERELIEMCKTASVT